MIPHLIPPNRVHVDFETSCQDVDLKEVGVTKYARDPSTEILMLGYAFGDEEPKIWDPEIEDFPLPLLRAMQQNNVFWAFNASFEIAIWKWVLTPRYKIPEIPINKWKDTRALALNYNLPGKLETCAEVLNLDFKKFTLDKKYTKEELFKVYEDLFVLGRIYRNDYPSLVTRVITEQANKFPSDTGRIVNETYKILSFWVGGSIVNSISKPPRKSREDYPELYKAAYEYCKQDVVVERELLKYFPYDLSVSEWDTWRNTVKKNELGIPVDVDLARSCVEVTGKCLEGASELITVLTDSKITSTQQVIRFPKWCKEQGYDLPDCGVETLTAALKDPKIEAFPLVKNVLELRHMNSKSSVQKLQKVLDCYIADISGINRIHDGVDYHFAVTGREAGRLFQPQNITRATSKNVEAVIEMFLSKGYLDIIEAFEDPLFTISTLIRPTIKAPQGYKFIVADYKSIEYLVCCWLAEQQDKIELFTSGKDPYKVMASVLYQVPYENVTPGMRQHGKKVCLGYQYGMSVKRFTAECIKEGLFITPEESSRSKEVFKDEYPEIVSFTYELIRTAKVAIRCPGIIFPCRRLAFLCEYDFLFCILPNGKFITYPRPRIGQSRGRGGRTWETIFFKKIYKKSTHEWLERKLTPAIGIENGTQATAREPLMEAVPDLVLADYKIPLLIHDEVLIEEPTDGRGIDDVIKILCDRSSYFEGLPIQADGFETQRYKKG